MDEKTIRDLNRKGAQIGITYYDLDGMPIGLGRWAAMYEDWNVRRIAETKMGPEDNWWVSTIWLGMDHNWGEGPPLIFETMIFEGGDACDLYMDRYSTLEEAMAGHVKAVDWLKQHLAEIEALTTEQHVDVQEN